MTKHTNKRGAFTLVELLVVISIIALLVGILLPAISRARDNAKIGQSKSNIRNVKFACDLYMNDHNGKQWTGVPEMLSAGPGSPDPNGAYPANWTGLPVMTALEAWQQRYYTPQSQGGGTKGTILPGIQPCETDGGGHWFYHLPYGESDHVVPYCFPEGLTTSGRGFARQGTYRFPNTRHIAEYMDDKCYHKAYWSPKERVVLRELQQCFDSNGTTCDTSLRGSSSGGYTVDIPFLLTPSSYGFSAPNMVNSFCYRKPKDADEPQDSFTDPMAVPAGFRSNTLSQCKFSSQKTYLMEMHWLNNQTSGECGPNWSDSTISPYHTPSGDDISSSWSYDGCYPHYFNASFRSAPVASMCDGSITQISVEIAEKDDYVVANGNNSTNDVATYKGLWHRGATGEFEWGFFLECHSDWSLWSGHTHTAGGLTVGMDLLAH